ncbi:MAG: hypothetical protein R3F60_16815 [bacterium]
MHEGLFAFEGDALRHHFQTGPDLDHVGWFARIGLPSHGPDYDAILRGRVTHDVDTGRVIIGIYGAAYLSNRRYKLVVEAFGLDEGQVVEKRLTEPY